jgi:hypothetical protein
MANYGSPPVRRNGSGVNKRSRDVSPRLRGGLRATNDFASDLLASMRAKFNAASLKTERFGENLTMFSGPGGSVVVLNGPDGKFVVDTFVAPAWPRLKEALDGLGNAPVKCVINTCASNNALLRTLFG